MLGKVYHNFLIFVNFTKIITRDDRTLNWPIISTETNNIYSIKWQHGREKMILDTNPIN